MTTITGLDAIAHATLTGATLRKHADPVDGAREITVDEARAIAREDAGLVWCEVVSYEVVGTKPTDHIGERILHSTYERAEQTLDNLVATTGWDRAGLKIVERDEAPDAGF